MKSNRQKCIDTWQWIVDHPGSNKADWAVANRDLALEVSHCSNCFACEEAGTDCYYCPVDWSGEEDPEIVCEDEESPYEIWDRDKTVENAQAVLDCIKNTWEE